MPDEPATPEPSRLGRFVVSLVVVLFLGAVGGAFGYAIGVPVSYGLPVEHRPSFSGGRGCVYVCLLLRLGFACAGATTALTIYAVVRRRRAAAERDGQLQRDYEEPNRDGPAGGI